MREVLPGHHAACRLREVQTVAFSAAANTPCIHFCTQTGRCITQHLRRLIRAENQTAVLSGNPRLIS